MSGSEIRRTMALFPISIVMQLTDLTARQIRYYEEHQLISPARTEGNRRLFSLNDIDKLLEVKDLLDQGINMAGIKKIYAVSSHNESKLVSDVSNEKEEKAKKQQGGVHGTNADKRHGSKKKISLFAAGPSREDNTRLIPKFKSPLEELNFIENDKRLQSLIDKLDSGKKVDSQDQHYVEHLLKRHKTLCELLGIEDDEEADLDDDSPDLLDKLEQPFSDRF